MWAECRRDTDREHQFDKAKKNRHLNFMGVLENQCLVLNRSWQAVNVITVQAALSMMAADAATGMNFTEGNFVPVRWNDWLNLPVRAEDDCIGTVLQSAHLSVKVLLE